MKKFFKALVSKPVVKRSARAALFAFLAAFLPSLLGWLGDVSAWASDQTGAVVFPDPSVLVKATVSAFVGVVAGLLAAVLNAVENVTGKALFNAKTTKLD